MASRRTALRVTAGMLAAAAACDRPAPRAPATLEQQAAAMTAALRDAERTGDPFADALADAYLEVAEIEAARSAFADSIHLAAKGRRALDGEAVAPDEPSDGDVPESRVQSLQWAREELMKHLDGTYEPSLGPAALARCVAAYDCSLTQAADSRAPLRLRTCGIRFADCGAIPQTPDESLGGSVALMDCVGADAGPHARAVAEQLAQDWLSYVPGYGVHLVGHTDTVGEADANLALSVRLAEAFATALVDAGAEPLRIIAIEGRGETDLAVPTGDSVRNAANCRVVITFGVLPW